MNKAELENLRRRGVSLPRHPARALETAEEMKRMTLTPGQLKRDVTSLRDIATAPLSRAEQRQQQRNAALVQEFKRRRGNVKTSSSFGDVGVATPRFYDPLEYWDLSGLPWNMADEGHRHKLHKWMRLYYATHRLVPILVDIFTRFPLVGMHFTSKDTSITKFYEELFLDRLKYEEYLVKVGREFWVVGEAWDLISFNESLGVIERCELLNPEDIVIENFPLLGSQQFKVTPPEYLRRLVDTKSPPKEYKQLEINFPELIPYLRRNEPFPISDVMLKQVAFKLTDWDDHGTPILLRGLRTLMHEEKLLASQDAIAERLYSPLILAKLGVQELGPNQGPWIPSPDDLEAFRDDLDIALASDFRVIVHHFALEIENVFGREQVPDLSADFDRVERSLMWVFGMNPSMFGGGSESQPYASSALHAEFMNQMLTTFQKNLKDLCRSRMLLVAEAQRHYDFERKGQTRVPIYEEVVEQDDEGNLQIVKKPKLLVPDLEFECLSYDTRISTPTGLVAVQEVSVGDPVLSWDVERDCSVESVITHSRDNGIQPVFRITTTMGRCIEATHEHPFLTKEGWVKAQDLSLGNELRVGTDVSPLWDEVHAIELVENVPTWSLGVKDTYTHITEGLVTHNTFDLRDEATQRQFLTQMRTMGAPISDRRMMVGFKSEYWEDSLDEMQTEMVQKTVAQQHSKLMAYKILMTQGLPIPPDLKAEVESIGTETGPGGGAPPGAGAGGPPGMGGMGGMGGPPPPGAGGGMGGIVMPPPPPGLGAGPGTAPPGGGPPPAGPGGIGAPSATGNVPAVSNERRPGLTYNTKALARVNEILADLEKQKRLAKRNQTLVDNTEELPWSEDGSFVLRKANLAPHIRQALLADDDEE